MAAHPFSDTLGRERFRRAVQAVETRSAAEIVVAVRPRSAPYATAPWALGAASGYAALLYTLFAPPVFALGWIALIVVAAFAVGFLAVRAFGGLHRALTPAAAQDDAVLRAARATFVALRVDATRERSGVLVYVSLLEQRVRVIADVGVLARAGGDAWAEALARIEGALHEHGAGGDGREALAVAIEALAAVLEGPLPRAADDVDELEDVA